MKRKHVGCTPGVSLEIGRVRESDLEAISGLHVHFWGEPSDVEAMGEALRQLEDDPDHILLAARIGGECVGTATGVICHGLYSGLDTYLVIEDVVVDEAFRRRGIASSLVTELERFARERSCRQMIVLTESVRHDAHGMYGALGFESRWTGFKKKLGGV